MTLNHSSNSQGYDYSRSGNPTRNCLEELLASLEKAKFALTYASGLAATDNVVHLLKAGDHLVAFDDLYGGVGRLLRACAIPSGISVDFVDARDANIVAAAIKPTTKVLLLNINIIYHLRFNNLPVHCKIYSTRRHNTH